MNRPQASSISAGRWSERLLAQWPRWPGWHRLPRDARDTIYLLAVIAWTVVPHLGHLPWWCGALAATVLAWRAQIALANGALPGRWSIFAVLALATALTLATERTLLGREAGVTMLVVLMALKTLELRARRDAFVVFFLGFFLVLTNFLYSQSLLTAAAMLGSVWGLLGALVLAHMPVGRPPLRKALALSARTALLGAPVMLALFLLFPRFGPLWGLPQDALGRTGLSGTMRLGSVAEIANDDSIAFRLRFLEDARPDPESLYFRGPVLTQFDGAEWRDSAGLLGLPVRSSAQAADLQLQGQGFAYEITLEPIRLPILPLLEATPARQDAMPQIEGWSLTPRADLVWRTDRLIGERLRFTVRAWPQFAYGARTSPTALREALQLPATYNPRTLAWARALRADPRFARAEARELAAAVLRHVRNDEFSYTLAPGLYGRDVIDEFWLERKAGFCEHFAAAFVVVMRAMDVPARVVTGYQGADPVTADGYAVVRQSHAHAWAEYWQAGTGWIRADPTAAVAPDRIVRSLNLRPAPGALEGALGSVSPELMRQARQAWETLNNRWNQWVLSYSRAQQFDLLAKLGVRAPDWADLGLLLGGLLSAAALVGAIWAWLDRHRQDPWQRLLGRVRDTLAALGVAGAPHHPPQTLAALARARLGSAGEGLAQQLESLAQQRYGRQALRRPDPAWWKRFREASSRLVKT